MPYIEPEMRDHLDVKIGELAEHISSEPGDLNYTITRLVVLWIQNQGGLRYRLIAAVTGVLKNVADEFYRRVAAPYEDSKCSESGDVYNELL